MRNRPTIIDAVGVVPSGSGNRVENATGGKPAFNGMLEASLKVLGTLLVLYRHYIPKTDYYEVKHTTES